jgi:hypothetical protein
MEEGMKRRVFLAGLASLPMVGGAKAGLIDRATSYRWVRLTEDGGLAARDSGAGFRFNGRLWISNGYAVGSVAVRDLVASDDGIVWDHVNDATPYKGYAAVRPFQGYIYVYDGQMTRTRDGSHYEPVATTNNPPFEPESAMFELNGKLHIITKDDVASFDPPTGQFAVTPHPVPARWGQVRIKFKDRLYIVAGAKDGANSPPENPDAYPQWTTVNDVWSTDNPQDPTSWKKHETPPWRRRMWPGLVVHGDLLYLTGGWDNFNAVNLNDTWRSPDGENWERVTVTESYPARHAPTLFSFEGRILMVCGNTNVSPSVQNDVWQLCPA